jgi:uncharacterized protein (TIGR02001 family)
MSKWLCYLILPCIAPAGTLAARELPHVSVHAAVASQYVHNGLQRSQGEPIVKARIGVASESGWSASLAASTLDFNPGRGPARELDFYVAKALQPGPDWSVVLTLADYEFGPDGPAATYDYKEAGIALGWRDMLALSVQFSPDYTSFSRRGIHRSQDTWVFEGAVKYPLRAGWELDAGLGHRNLQGLEAAYWYWSAGSVLTLGRCSLALSYINSDGRARSLFRSAARDLLVVTLGVRLH